MSIEFEGEIVWLEDVSSLEYVRENEYLVRRRRGRPAFNPGRGGRLLGWANLRPDAQGFNQHFERRVFWVKASDPYHWPTEAVLTSSIRVGAPSVRANGEK